MKILIADRTRRVGEFLKRELERDHHTVFLTDTGWGVVEQVDVNNGYQLLIIDPDFPDMEDSDIFQSVYKKNSSIATIVHAYPGDDGWKTDKRQVVARVEKKGNSIDSIRTIVKKLSQEVHC